MRRTLLLLAIPLGVLLGTIAGVIALEQGQPPGWERALQLYLDTAAPVQGRAQVMAAEQARQPWEFRPELGSPVHQDEVWTWQIDQLPYPPDDLYCVLLGYPAGAATSRQVVYVAHHTDNLWRVGWLVHLGPVTPFPATLAADLAQVGCSNLTAQP